MNDGLTQPALQFGTAGGDRCQFCHQPLATAYYRVNDAMGCANCVETMRRERDQDSHAAFVRGITAGAGAALLGMIGYAIAAIILQGWVFSITAIGVGYLVGVAMMKYSKGVGGRRYQVAAVLLTYAAISTAAIPISIYFSEHRPALTEQQKLQAEQRELEREFGQRQQTPTAAPPTHAADIGTSVGRLALLGLASPFLQLATNPSSAIGLLILFVGMRVAWRITAGRPFEVFGPFDNVPQAQR